MTHRRHRVRLVREHESPDDRIEQVVGGKCGQVGFDKTHLLEIERGGVGTRAGQNFQRPVNTHDGTARANEFGGQRRDATGPAANIEDPPTRANSGLAQHPLCRRTEERTLLVQAALFIWGMAHRIPPAQWRGPSHPLVHIGCGCQFHWSIGPFAEHSGLTDRTVDSNSRSCDRLVCQLRQAPGRHQRRYARTVTGCPIAGP
jgi:hypothetical protein